MLIQPQPGFTAGVFKAMAVETIFREDRQHIKIKADAIIPDGITREEPRGQRQKNQLPNYLADSRVDGSDSCLKLLTQFELPIRKLRPARLIVHLSDAYTASGPDEVEPP